VEVGAAELDGLAEIVGDFAGLAHGGGGQTMKCRASRDQNPAAGRWRSGRFRDR
jgi:hypothetical protein